MTNKDIQFRINRRPLFQYIKEQGIRADGILTVINATDGWIYDSPDNSVSCISKMRYIVGFRLDLFLFSFDVTWLKWKKADVAIKGSFWNRLKNDYTPSFFKKITEKVLFYIEDREYGSKEK